MSDAQATQLLSTHYGLTARVESLGSNQDKNFLVYDGGDHVLGVPKIANPAFTARRTRRARRGDRSHRRR